MYLGSLTSEFVSIIGASVVFCIMPSVIRQYKMREREPRVKAKKAHTDNCPVRRLGQPAVAIKPKIYTPDIL